MSELHPLLPPCVRAAGCFSELYLAEVLPTLSVWRPGEELVREHQALRQLILAAGDAGALYPRVAARALEQLGHKPEAPKGPNQPFALKAADGRVHGLALATAQGAPLDTGPRGQPSPQRVLERALHERGLRAGVLTNGVAWRLLYTPPGGAPGGPYEVEPGPLLTAPFFSEPFRYFSLFFRAASFDGFFRDCVAGSQATWSASAQALRARALSFLREHEDREEALYALSRALFALLGAARGLDQLPARVAAARAFDEEALRGLCERPAPPGPPASAPLVRRALQALAPPDLTDPSGLRDARLPDPLALPEIVRAAAGEEPPRGIRVLARRALLTAGPGALVDLRDGGGLWLGALVLEAAALAWEAGGDAAEELRRAAARAASLSPQVWRADLSRLTLRLAGADEAHLARIQKGALSEATPASLALAPDGQEPSLFSALARPAIEAAAARPTPWLGALADAWAAARAGVLIGYETLLSLVSQPARLLASPGVRKAQLWALAHGVRHLGITFPGAGEPISVLLAAPTDLERPEALFLQAAGCLRGREVMFLVGASGWLRRQSSGPARVQLARQARALSLIEGHGWEAAILVAPAADTGVVSFYSLDRSDASLIPGPELPWNALTEPPGAPWSQLRAPPAVALAARVRARSWVLHDIVSPQAPGTLFLAGGRVALAPVDGAAPYVLREPGLDPGYVAAAAASRLARYVLKLEGEPSALQAPIPRVRFSMDEKRRQAEKKALLPLLSAGKYEALLARAEQLLARGEEDPIHDLIASAAYDPRSEALREGLLYRLLGVSLAEETLLGGPRPPAPPPALPPKPPRPSPRAEVDPALRQVLLDALAARGELSSNEAQGLTQLDSRRLRLLLAELEAAGDITRAGRGRGTRYYPKPS